MYGCDAGQELTFDFEPVQPTIYYGNIDPGDAMPKAKFIKDASISFAFVLFQHFSSQRVSDINVAHPISLHPEFYADWKSHLFEWI
ncbi:MAG: hypothetical protein H2045_12960 [Rhizobiales bacterium]|nr:hypothetical protein [Hyphomicrobiales bacterium]